MLYAIICGLKRYLEDENGGNALNSLDSSNKKYFSSGCTFVPCAFMIWNVCESDALLLFRFFIFRRCLDAETKDATHKGVNCKE